MRSYLSQRRQGWNKETKRNIARIEEAKADKKEEEDKHGTTQEQTAQE